MDSRSPSLDASKTEYIDCNLDPDEYRRLGAGPNEAYSQQDDQASQGYFQPFVATVQEAPIRMWAFLMTIIYFVVTPLASSDAFIKCRRTGKKVKRSLSKSYRQYQKYGVYQPITRKA